MSTHTPGPWRVVDVPGEASHIVNADNFTIVRQGYVSAMDTANAHLIAAAPDLLAACKQLVALFAIKDPKEIFTDAHRLKFADAYADMRAAIAKAEGVS